MSEFECGNRRFSIASMDAEGEIISQHTTEKDWCLSELDRYFDILKVALYNGVIDHILISKAEE